MSADNLLTELDDAFARAQHRPGRARTQPASPVVSPNHATDDAAAQADDEDAPAPAMTREDWILFGFLAIQFLWGLVLFVPGTQAVRPYLRALPYLTSGGLLPMYLFRHAHHRRPAGTALVVSALMLLVVNLLHPASQLVPGLAQCLFQLCIAAPLLWGHKLVHSRAQLQRVLHWVLLMNLASASVGVLQVYYPDTFLPAQFSSGLSESYLSSLTYIGRDGRTIVRPPGLSDLPGAASLAGGITAVLALSLMLNARGPKQQSLLIAATAIGVAVVYLTQVRSVLLISMASMVVTSIVAVRQGRLRNALWIGTVGGAVVVASFIWASAVGGSAVDNRFLSLRDQGAMRVYQENRGNFLAYTLGELLDQYPLGAGVGRWGMMNQYFADPNEYRSAPIHVEIQPTGWLLDGGIPMWFLYGGAVLFSILTSFALASNPATNLFGPAVMVLSAQVMIAGMSLSGPSFNTQLGILFWLLASALHGARTGEAQSAA